MRHARVCAAASVAVSRLNLIASHAVLDHPSLRHPCGNGRSDQGAALMSPPTLSSTLVAVPQFLIHHRHGADDCGVVFASFHGFASPLRHTPTLSSCPGGGHEIWWSVEAHDEAAALSLLPFYVATRATATRVGPVHIP
jgi:hypothetical protein